ncbi:MAG: hypothetical protein ABIE94_05040 [archaeon]
MCEYRLMDRCFHPERAKPGVLAVECVGCSNCTVCSGCATCNHKSQCHSMAIEEEE